MTVISFTITQGFYRLQVEQEEILTAPPDNTLTYQEALEQNNIQNPPPPLTNITRNALQTIMEDEYAQQNGFNLTN